jgi:carboxymethylenebutenolidase
MLRILCLITAWLLAFPAMAEHLPQTVHFMSADGKTTLVGYLYLPAHSQQKRVAAVVMLHGRAGPYSSLAQGEYDATTLSKRHKFWGEYWANQGYAALLVDSFGPRGYASGFQIHSYQDRPDAVNEVTVRPLDAYGALAYLKTRVDIDGSHIALQGWSNGGSTTIATMADVTLDMLGLKPTDGFRGAVAFYPACALHGVFDARYHPYAPLWIFSGDNDEEVSAKTCARLTARAEKTDANMQIEVLPGATHDFDDPGKKRQSVEANAEALSIVKPQVTEIFVQLLRQ